MFFNVFSSKCYVSLLMLRFTFVGMSVSVQPRFESACLYLCSLDLKQGIIVIGIGW